MTFNVKFRSIAVLFMLFILNVSGVLNEQEWVNRLIKYIKTDMQITQTVLIISGDVKIQDNKISHVVGKIQQEIPSLVISLSNFTTHNTQINASISFYQSFGSSTLFITIPFLKESSQQLKSTDTTDLLIQLSEPKTRPKCLMIALLKKGKVSYRKLLHIMWSYNFLDFTILEIAEKQVEKSCLLRDCYQFITRLYNFNPFNGVYTEQEYTKRRQIFPNKLLDLNGFEMKVGSFHFLPNVDVKRDPTGYPVEVSGSDALFAKALSKKMNFRLSEVPSQEESFGNWHCDNEKKRTGFAYLLGNNTIRFITDHGAMFPNCAKQGLHSTSTGYIPVCVLIPVINVEISTISPTPRWIYLVSLIFIIRIITILLKFDDDVWPWFEILRESLGMAVPREPSRLSERIVFISIVVAFTIFSSNIFAILTDTKLTKKSEITIDTLEELNRTNLIPTTIANMVYVMRKTNDPVIQALADKSSIVLKYEECVDMLVKGKDVACILRQSTALMAIREHKDTDPVMRIMKERVFSANKAMHIEPNSPYIQQVDAIIHRLIESGLKYHWEKQFSTPERKSHQWETEEVPDSDSILIPLIFFITFGCSVSIVAFICELLLKYINNRFQECAAFFAQGNVF